MATGKTYYWMRLKESFLNSDTVDFFMSQPNGANYVVLYQALCLKTINTEGRLSRQIGDIIIPFDIEKIRRDCKWFSADTIRVALEYYKRFGLIYQDVDGTLVMADHHNLVGKTTDYADQKKAQRIKNAEKPKLLADGGVDNVHSDVHTEIRDIESRDIDTPLYPPTGGQKGKSRPDMDPKPEDRFSGELLDAVNSWLDYKWERNKSNYYKETGYKSLITQLGNCARDYGEAAVAQVIRYSMANNYQGICFGELKKGARMPETVYSEDSKAYRAAKYFADQKLADYPDRSQPTEADLQKWAKALEELHTQNGVKWQVMADAMFFACENQWWCHKVQSAYDFKRYFNEIFADMVKEQGAVKEE